MKVAIVWYGAEGQSNYRYYSEKGDDVTIVTPKVAAQYPLPEGAQAVVRDDAFNFLNGYDLVVRSAGIRPDSLKTDGKIWSATNEFFAHCPAPIIGVTGTKGKGTTSSLIASILKAAGKTVHLVGNIGVPALEVLSTIQPDDVVVFELSSFQLWDLEKSPHIAVVLMIEPDHMDVHHSIREYVDAKAHIVTDQNYNDIVIYHPTNEFSVNIANRSAGKRMRFSLPDDGGVYIKSNTFFVQDKQICSTDVVQLPGAHNLENACAAVSAALVYDQSISEEAIAHGLSAFHGLPHRLKFVREVNGVRYFDDSIGTTPGSAIAAMNSFDSPEIIILGGSDKGAPYNEVVEIAKQKNATILAVGQTGEKIADIAEEYGVSVYRLKGRMDEAVKKAQEIAVSGSVVVLSPASASFDQYKSYADRGEQFIAAVQSL